MKASELIKALQAKIDQEGDLEVVLEVISGCTYMKPVEPETQALFNQGIHWMHEPDRHQEQADHEHLIVLRADN
jgi:hypothetical protein